MQQAKVNEGLVTLCDACIYVQSWRGHREVVTQRPKNVVWSRPIRFVVQTRRFCAFVATCCFQSAFHADTSAVRLSCIYQGVKGCSVETFKHRVEDKLFLYAYCLSE